MMCIHLNHDMNGSGPEWTVTLQPPKLRLFGKSISEYSEDLNLILHLLAYKLEHMLCTL